MVCYGTCVCSAPLMLGRCCPRTWWWSVVPQCCRVSSTGCWLRYASWWRNQNTATCWQARASVYTLLQPSPTAPPGSEVRHDVFVILVSAFVDNNYCVSENPHYPHLHPTAQVLYLELFRTSWAAGLCHGTITTRRVAFQTGAAWAPLLPSPCTKQERPLLRSWREPFPQRSRSWHTWQTVYFIYPTEHHTYLSVTYCYVWATDSFRC